MQKIKKQISSCDIQPGCFQLYQNVKAEHGHSWSSLFDEWKRIPSCFLQAKCAFLSMMGNIVASN